MEFPENHTVLSGLGYHVSAAPGSLLATAAADFLISGTAEPGFPDLMSIQPPPEPTVNPTTTITFKDAASAPYLYSGDQAEQTVVNPSVVTPARGGRSAKLDSLNRIAHSAGRLLNHTSLCNNNGFFSPLSSAASYGFFATMTETRVCSPQPCSSSGKEQVMRWSSPSQLSFTTDHNNRCSMSPMSQVCESSKSFSISFDNNGHRGATRSHDLGLDSRYPNNFSSFFSVSPGTKRSRTNNGGRVLNYSSIDLASQITPSPEENDWHIPEGSFACKKAARSSSTTHRRSIAERERRTRINNKLRKLQEVVPNVDKETSYAEMLDFTVEHLKGLQNQVQQLRKKLDTCKCGRNPIR